LAGGRKGPPEELSGIRRAALLLVTYGKARGGDETNNQHDVHRDGFRIEDGKLPDVLKNNCPVKDVVQAAPILIHSPAV
jgi:hypothetical protein